ncbi:MAG: NifU family protein [Patescibacteria group bacterium]
MENKIKKALDKVRPALQADGGDVEFVSFNEKTGVVEVKLVGVCSHCPMAGITLSQGIEVELKKEVPEVKKVVSV